MMDDLASLELLSLVSKITSELHNHLGINDKTLAEFVIAQHAKCESLTGFKTHMANMGADFSASLLESIDRLITTMHPKYSHKRKEKNPDLVKADVMALSALEKNVKLFPGLTIQNKDDTFAILEGLAGKEPRGRKRGRSPEGYADRNEPRGRQRNEFKDRKREDRGRNGYTASGAWSSDVPVVEGDMSHKQSRSRKRLTSPERWEIRQLIASGAVSAKDYPDIDEEYNATMDGEGGFEEEVDIDIEVRDEEPPFLAGQTKQSLELSPIRVIKAPDGSLNRAAVAKKTLLEERRNLRQQEAQAKTDKHASSVDLNAGWQDPMVAPDQRKFASDIRNPLTLYINGKG